MAITATSPHLLHKVRLLDAQGNVLRKDKSIYPPSAVDVWCINSDAGTLAPGWWLAPELGAMSNGQYPRMHKATSAMLVAGVVAPDAPASIAVAAGFWLRVYGIANAYVDGTTDVAADDVLVIGSTAGVAILASSLAGAIGQAIDARSDNSAGLVKVFVGTVGQIPGY